VSFLNCSIFFPDSSGIPVIFTTDDITNSDARDFLSLTGTHIHYAVYAEVPRLIHELTHQQIGRATSGGRIYDLLQKREQEHFALNQSAIVSMADSAGQVTEVNRRFCNTSQYSETELLGQLATLISEANAHVLSGHWASAPETLQSALQHLCGFLGPLALRVRSGAGSGSAL
jgi:PAS domain-containing protein